MDQMTIRQKLYAVFGVIIGIFACVSVYSGYNLYQINNGAMRIATEHMNSVLSLSQASSSLSVYRQCEYAMASAPTLSGQVYAAQEMRNLGNQMDIAFDNIAGSMDGEKEAVFNQMRQKWEAYRKGNANLEQLVGSGRAQEALLHIAQTENAYNEVNWELGLVVDGHKDFIQQEVNEAAARYEQAKVTLIVSTLIVLVLSGFMAGALGKSINSSVSYLMGISKEVAQGNLTVPVEVKTQDEFGILT
ncbi:MAG: MCP four helix bundle domain-containing protein, partial [Selenomonadaceae bacterium]|nr:MCP four helix bundle domain-containing protein [Selenomonadaceae bacterium]